jgi:molecular chaperone GrpE
MSTIPVPGTPVPGDVARQGDEPGEGSRVKVVDRRWWARGEQVEPSEAPAAKPSYVEELEARLQEKDRLLQGYIEQYKHAAAEFEETRARGRREVAREVERGKRALLVDLLELVDNLDRAIDAAKDRAPDDPLLHGVQMVRQQFLARLEGYGITEIAALGEPFDPAQHEAIVIVPVASADEDERVAGVIRRGYRIADEVLRPAMVAVGRVGA